MSETFIARNSVRVSFNSIIQGVDPDLNQPFIKRHPRMWSFGERLYIPKEYLTKLGPESDSLGTIRKNPHGVMAVRIYGTLYSREFWLSINQPIQYGYSHDDVSDWEVVYRPEVTE